MNKTSDFIKQRICWKAKQFNLSQDAFFIFHDLSTGTQDYLKQITSKENVGEPVLFFTKDESKWTLLCTNSVIGFDNEYLYKVNYKDIKRILPKVLDGIEIGQAVDVSRTPKTKFNELVVTDNSESEFTFHTKTGQDHFALHNVLLMLRKIL